MKILELIFWLIVIYILIGIGDYFWNKSVWAIEDLKQSYKELKEAKRNLEGLK